MKIKLYVLVLTSVLLGDSTGHNTEICAKIVYGVIGRDHNTGVNGR